MTDWWDFTSINISLSKKKFTPRTVRYARLFKSRKTQLVYINFWTIDFILRNHLILRTYMKVVITIDLGSLFNQFLYNWNVAFPARPAQGCLVTVIQCIHISSSLYKFSDDFICKLISYLIIDTYYGHEKKC